MKEMMNKITNRSRALFAENTVLRFLAIGVGILAFILLWHYSLTESVCMLLGC